jgi:hypothetical protein
MYGEEMSLESSYRLTVKWILKVWYEEGFWGRDKAPSK